MPKTKAKNLLISHDGKHVIFYQNTGMVLIIQVFPHSTMQSALDQQEYLQKYYAWHNLPLGTAIASFRRQAFLLASVRTVFTTAPDYVKLQNTVKRLADWYLFSYIIPLANNQPPDIPPTDLIM